jgi:hypothetical protein
VKDVRELIAYSKANPGRLSYASSGSNLPHLAGVLFNGIAGTDLARALQGHRRTQRPAGRPGVDESPTS